MKKISYRQCSLSQGTGRTHGYIELRGAKVGKMVELVPGSGDFWRVDQVGDKTVSHEYLNFARDANKHASISA